MTVRGVPLSLVLSLDVSDSPSHAVSHTFVVSPPHWQSPSHSLSLSLLSLVHISSLTRNDPPLSLSHSPPLSFVNLSLPLTRSFSDSLTHTCCLSSHPHLCYPSQHTRSFSPSCPCLLQFSDYTDATILSHPSPLSLVVSRSRDLSLPHTLSLSLVEFSVPPHLLPLSLVRPLPLLRHSFSLTRNHFLSHSSPLSLVVICGLSLSLTHSLSFTLTRYLSHSLSLSLFTRVISYPSHSSRSLV